MADLTKLAFHSGYNAFKNNNVYTGSFTISGTTAAGTNTVTATVPLDAAPDLTDVIFNGTAGGGTLTRRPSAGWFKNGLVEVRGDNAGAGYTNYPTPWIITSKIDGSNLVITATYVQTFNDALTLTSTTVSYKLVDYSVF